MWIEVKVLYWLVRFSPTCFWSSDPSATRVFFFFFKKSDLVGWSHGDGGIVGGSKGLSLSGSSWVVHILLVGWSYFLVDPIIQSSWVLYILLKKNGLLLHKKKSLLLHKKKSIDNKIINLE